MSTKYKIIGVVFKTIKAFHKVFEWVKGPIIDEGYRPDKVKRSERKRNRKEAFRVMHSDHKRRSTDLKS